MRRDVVGAVALTMLAFALVAAVASTFYHQGYQRGFEDATYAR